MKIEAPENSNYAATVVRLPHLLELDGLDNLVAAPLFGFQALIGREHEQGELGITFPPEVQLSQPFCYNNSLFRHQEQNIDTETKGYIEDNRRVRAIRLRGHRSDCLFMPLESLAFTGANLLELNEGDTFDHLNSVEICKKYVVRTKTPGVQRFQEKKFSRVDPRLFPEHISTDQYDRNSHVIGQDEWVTVTAKLHGSSFRASRSLVLRKLTLRDRIARRLGAKVETHEWAVIAGSRKVIKDPLSEDQNHFYSYDLWSAYLKKVEHALPEGWIIYGELVGYTEGNSPIQTDYFYDQPIGTHSLYVYRIATVNPKGILVDLSWPQVKEWCVNNDLKHVPELWSGYHRDFNPDFWIDARFCDMGFDSPAPNPNKKIVDEGVCIRADKITPIILKKKGSRFFEHETKLLDKGVEDIESQEMT